MTIAQVKNRSGEWVDVKEFRKDVDYVVLGKRKARTLRKARFLFNGEWYELEEGFEWNTASVPWIFWFVIGKPTSEKFAMASLFHDYLYMMRADRGLADNLFRELLDDAKVNGRRVAAMFWAVRIGGWWFYR